jgi:3-isopropylmalate/(R)-2-methylmalate dehydratase small subunit
MMAAAGADPATAVEIDLEDRRVRVPAAGIDEPFALADSIRRRLLDGLDEIGLTLQKRAAIERYEAGRPRWLPRLDDLDVPPAL